MITRIVTVAVAALVGGWALARYAYEPHRCNAAITAVDVSTTVAAADANDYARLVRARSNLQRLAALGETCPTDVRVPMLTGANEELVGRPEDAIRSYDHALTIEQRPEIYVARASVQLGLGRLDEAVKSYVQAARFAPDVEIASEEIRARVKEQLARP